jgi:hypothetical protein
MENYSHIDWESFAKDNKIFSIVSDTLHEILFNKEDKNNESFN